MASNSSDKTDADARVQHERGRALSLRARESKRSCSQPYVGSRADLLSDAGRMENKDQSDLHGKYFSSSSSHRGWGLRGRQSNSTRGLNRQGISNFQGPRNSRTQASSVLHQDANLRQKRYDHQDNKPKPITCDLLNIWAKMEDAGQLVLKMSSEKQQLETFVNQSNVKEDWLVPLVKAVSHAITAQHQKESIKQLLDSLCKTQFLEHLTTYITEKQVSGDIWSEADEFFRSCMEILKEVLMKLPQFANICITTTTVLLNATQCIESIRENKSLLDEITAYSKKAQEVFLAEKDKVKKSGTGIFRSNNLEEPPDNFVDLPVVPSEFDLREDANPFIRCAKIEGGYKDVHHYLDIQFRLMREDFILPLRVGVTEFKESGCKKNFRSSDLRFYSDVHIIGTVFTDGINHILQFDISALQNVTWEFSKRLMFGSLLCLSKDNFQTILFATVAHHDVANLAKGFVIVNFKTGLDDVFNSSSSDVYIMAETTAFFESYCHVLEGLQEMFLQETLTKLTLHDYIIHCKTELKPPHYLLPSGGITSLPVYNLSSLMKDKAETMVAVLTTVKWPKADAMCLNESQKEAVQLALTKELAIIQGPPGTGKTYVGLKVMQVLLENKDVMAGNENENSSDPILVVCYTNHALDQFLEGVLEFCPEGIVRIGGQSKSEKLEHFNITNLKRNLRDRNVLSSSSLKQSVKECNKEMEKISDQISELNQIMESLKTDIKNVTVLKQYMKSTHHDSLLSASIQFSNSKEQMNKWLSTSSGTAQSLIRKMIKQHLTMLVLMLDNLSSNNKLSSKMNIILRAGFYNQVLKSYKRKLMKDIYFLSKNQQNVARIQAIKDSLKIAQKRILPDHELRQVLFPGALKIMIQDLEDRSNISIPEDAVVENWLLGLNKDLQSQLDDIEILTNLNKKGKVKFANFVKDDAFVKAQNDRMVDFDGVHTEKFNASLRAAFNNITSVLQRGDMLGISTNTLVEDDQDDNEYKTVTKTRLLNFKAVQQKLKLIEPMTEERESSIENVWDLMLDERFALYNLWVKRYKQTLTLEMQELVINYKSVQDKKMEANSEETLFLLRKAKVIGMTTSGAARHRAVLQTVGCRIIIVEEAAEVLESHIVTALNKNCKHLILIGDHQQLRPNPAVYQLAKDFGLEMSLFERLIKNKVPYVALKEQHRMRPEISKIMLHIYPDLQDHPSVDDYESIRGVSKNIFFIQHENKESHLDESMSKANIHEANFLVALCKYLLNQDYDASQITILATYSGQVFEIKKTMKKQNVDLGVLVTAVDNYQGEENDIILLSLVRSNEENRVGFLKTDNRVCVALSRAKKGLFVIGNLKLLASQSMLWSNIVKTADLDQVFGNSLPVICQNHSDFQEIMISAEDFKKCPEGGCGRPCEYRLQCGHVCTLTCHGYDPGHLKYECHKLCTKKCEFGHPCTRKCYQDCPDCKVLVLKHIPLCGHEDQVPCSVSEDKAVCSHRCPHILECGHQCAGTCGQCRRTQHAKCVVPVFYQWPCGHTDRVPCHMNPSLYPCKKVCGAKLECGHNCTGKCIDCLEVAVHVACEEKCDKTLPCGHLCDSFCSVPCLPCSHKCPAKCHHDACFKAEPAPLCSHACPPCMKKCSYRCRHKECDKHCSENCNIKPCTKKCYKSVSSCKHKCAGLCGELCVCRKCEKVSEIPDKTEKSETLGDNCKGEKQVSPESKPLVTDAALENKREENRSSDKKYRLLLKIPSCSHIFYVDELDKYVSDFDLNGSSYIPCPACQWPILMCMRYENVNKERNRKREEEKSKLCIETVISEIQKVDLMKSQRRLEKSYLLTEFHLLDVKKVTNLVELQAMSFQLKCAFVLNAISSVMENQYESISTELLRSRKDAVLKIQGRLTNQQKSEFITELSRCFWLSYLSHLSSLSFLSYSMVSKHSEIDKEVKEIMKELSISRPSRDTLERAQFVSDIKNRSIQDESKLASRKAKLIFLEQKSVHTMIILKSRDEEMLCHLIEGGNEKDNLLYPGNRPAVELGSKTAAKNKFTEMGDKMWSDRPTSHYSDQQKSYHSDRQKSYYSNQHKPLHSDRHRSPPSDRHKPHHSDRHRSPPSDQHKPPHSDRHRLTHSDRHRSTHSDRHRSPSSDQYKPPHSDRHRSPHSDQHRSPPSDQHKPPHSDRHRSPHSDRHRSPHSDQHKPPRSDQHRSYHSDWRKSSVLPSKARPYSPTTKTPLSPHARSISPDIRSQKEDRKLPQQKISSRSTPQQKISSRSTPRREKSDTH